MKYKKQKNLLKPQAVAIEVLDEAMEIFRGLLKDCSADLLDSIKKGHEFSELSESGTSKIILNVAVAERLAFNTRYEVFESNTIDRVKAVMENFDILLYRILGGSVKVIWERDDFSELSLEFKINNTNYQISKSDY